MRLLTGLSIGVTALKLSDYPRRTRCRCSCLQKRRAACQLSIVGACSAG